MKIAMFLGTRPELVKMQPLIKEILRRDKLELTFVHTGQHYDWNMSSIFIKELDLPKPSEFLNVGSGSQAAQTSRIILRSERLLKRGNFDVTVVQGDTNSALGAALAAAKLKIPVCHVEAGCRCFDKNMPEEINRTLIADLASLHFSPTKSCAQNLVKEGVPKGRIYCTGHPIVDLLNQLKNRINVEPLAKLGLRAEEYYFVTIHREENVENKNRLEDMLEALSMLAQSRPVIFPIHPHTRKKVERYGLGKHLKNVKTLDPVGYLEALVLIRYAKATLTDSGGVQQEAALLGTPCVTLRPSTEWIETVKLGVNFLADSKEEIIKTVKELGYSHKDMENRFRRVRKIFGEPPVSNRIIDILEKSCFG